MTHNHRRRSSSVPVNGITGAGTSKARSRSSSIGSNGSDGASRPVRQQLKKASIAGIASQVAGTTKAQDGDTKPQAMESEETDTGRSRRRRREDDEEAAGVGSGEAADSSHRRKRSRDEAYSSNEEDSKQDKVAGQNDDVAAESSSDTKAHDISTPPRSVSDEDMNEIPKAIMSPKNKRDLAEYEDTDEPRAKRQRSHSPTAAKKAGGHTKSGSERHMRGSSEGAGENAAARNDNSIESTNPELEAAASSAKVDTTKDVEKADDAADSAAGASGGLPQSREQIPKSNSETKPATVKLDPPAQQKSSADSFASSGFAKLAASSQSPFAAAAAGAPSASPFASSSKGSGSVFGNQQPSAFGSFGAKASALGAPAASPFGGVGQKSSGSVFGGGSTLGGPSSNGLNSFATPGATGIVGLSTKPAKPFGAAVEEAEGAGESEEEETEGEAAAIVSEEKADKRFFNQDVSTGEENELCRFTSRAKLYTFVKTGDKAEWKERGVGTMKVNIDIASAKEEDAPLKARFIMRADGSHRVVLNAPIPKELKVGKANGEAPTNGLVLFNDVADPDHQLYQLKMKVPNAIQLFEEVKALQAQM